MSQECNTLLDAIRQIHPLHLTAKHDFDKQAFQFAQFSLLSQRHVGVPKEVPSSPAKQCYGTLELLRKTYPSTRLREFSLELLTNYTRQLDPHSIALSEEALASQSGFLNGFGFTVERSDDTGRVEVVDVIAGGPAHIAGLTEGMFIWTINRKYVREINTTELLGMINDRNSQELILGVLGSGAGAAPGSYNEIRVTRGRFEASPLKLNTYRVPLGGREYNIGYIKIRNFVGVQAFFAEALRTLRNSDALVLDLRNIAGGDIQAAADIADLLISQNDPFVGMLGRGTKLDEVVRMRSLSSAWDSPLAILVNASTKSAAEILAGALQDNGAIVVGTRTFGKGTRQRLVSLSNYGLSGGLYLTDAFTLRPSGKVIQFAGIQPDVTLPTRGQARTESAYPRSLLPPADQRPLQGYDPTAVPFRSSGFRKRLSDFETRLRTNIEAKLASSSQEDLQLEATKRVALFLAAEQEYTHSGANSRPPQLELPL